MMQEETELQNNQQTEQHVWGTAQPRALQAQRFLMQHSQTIANFR